MTDARFAEPGRLATRLPARYCHEVTAKHATEMLQTHSSKTQVDARLIEACIEACFDCAQTCTAGADACLGEQQVLQMLARYIRLNLDCADVCETTGRLVSRQTEPDWSVLRARLEACAAACRSCGAEYHKHAAMHAHCQVCANTCRRCAEACDRLLQALPA